MPALRPEQRSTNVPASTPLKTLVRLGKLRWRIEHDYREPETMPRFP